MKINKAIFKSSSSHYQQNPSDKLPDLALIGRSNVGKSSLINMLLDHKGLAKVSNKPGKTKLINHFLVNNTYYLVDLPGYGWARASKVDRLKWEKMVHAYLLHRRELRCVFILLDSRLPPQAIDLDFMHWLNKYKIFFAIVMTKADKLGTQTMRHNLRLIQEKLAINEPGLLRFLITSSKNRTGKQEVLNFIKEIVGPSVQGA
jgi:GTP-binding protein